MAPPNAPPCTNGRVETTLTGLRPASTVKRAAAAAAKAPYSAEADSSHQFLLGCAYVEVLGTQGAQPLANWRITGPPKALQKVFDRDCKSYVFCLPGPGLKLQAPPDLRNSLGLAHPFLVLQVLMGAGCNLTLELLLSDAKAPRRRVILSSVFSDAKITTLHSQVPLDITPDKWTHLVVPLAHIASTLSRGAAFRALDAITLSGCCSVRRVFTLRDPPHSCLAPAGPPATAVLQPQACGAGVHGGRVVPRPGSLMTDGALPLPKGLELPQGLDARMQVVDAGALSVLLRPRGQSAAANPRLAPPAGLPTHAHNPSAHAPHAAALAGPAATHKAPAPPVSRLRTPLLSTGAAAGPAGATQPPGQQDGDGAGSAAGGAQATAGRQRLSLVVVPSGVTPRVPPGLPSPSLSSPHAAGRDAGAWGPRGGGGGGGGGADGGEHQSW